ncbi:PhzF family phenazine biosynthesis protein [Kribbella pittospori]|uniref:PhzF family phenazine biosynthesis protein n=1 Tax=Kribbella pittospori TaxID=722689 RepID=A0A4R0K2Z0_9ACTN|nr:PhzF family phenazine biosynthesis isomerase [Kribbella pittospori]TCC52098.1 PhzF family phenazine biosynthesis protein [Kribbella pittospori]
MSPNIVVVNACQRGWQGGSPTAVVADDTSLSDAERCAIPVTAGTSHAVFISAQDHRSSRPEVSLRFFTAAGELPACGHGTVAALAVLAERAGESEYEVTLQSGGRTYRGRARGGRGRFRADFDPGQVELRAIARGKSELVVSALGLDPDQGSTQCQIASVGRPRMLVQVPDRRMVAELTPDLNRLREACDWLGLLGCYVYSAPRHHGRAAARMFAPSIGVPEDIANANSTACLAVHVATRGLATVEVDMGDSLGAPATIMASTRPGPGGPLVQVGGTATIPFLFQVGLPD